jgi:hypothetical protein
MPQVLPPPEPIGSVTLTDASRAPLKTPSTANVCTVVVGSICCSATTVPTKAASARRRSSFGVRGTQLHAEQGVAVPNTAGAARSTTTARRAAARSTPGRYSTVTDFARLRG